MLNNVLKYVSWGHSVSDQFNFWSRWAAQRRMNVAAVHLLLLSFFKSPQNAENKVSETTFLRSNRWQVQMSSNKTHQYIFPELWKWKWPKNHICCTRGKTCKFLTNLLKRKLIFNDCFNTLKGSWIDHWTLITKDTSDQFIQIHCLFVPQIFKSVISSWDEHKTMIPTFTLVW